jgi:hypothetical protein
LACFIKMATAATLGAAAEVPKNLRALGLGPTATGLPKKVVEIPSGPTKLGRWRIIGSSNKSPFGARKIGVPPAEESNLMTAGAVPKLGVLKKAEAPTAPILSAL